MKGLRFIRGPFSVKTHLTRCHDAPSLDIIFRNAMIKEKVEITHKKEDNPLNQNKEKLPFLSEVIKPELFKKGQANIVIAPCHSGKTTAAVTK